MQDEQPLIFVLTSIVSSPQYILMSSKKQNTSLLSFLHHARLTHDDANTPKLIDKNLRGHLHKLHTNEHLNNTLLILTADYDHRFADVRRTRQVRNKSKSVEQKVFSGSNRRTTSPDGLRLAGKISRHTSVQGVER